MFVSHKSHIRQTYTPFIHRTWLIPMSDMPHSYIGHDSWLRLVWHRSESYPMYEWGICLTYGGYTDMARLLGESCVQKMRGHLGKKIVPKSRNKLSSERLGCGSIRTVDSRRKFAQFWNQIQTLKECLCCHIYCAQLRAHLADAVGGKSAESCLFVNRCVNKCALSLAQ